MKTSNDKSPLAVVTGGGTGIGRAVCELLVESGYEAWALGLDRDPDLSGKINFRKVDITDTVASLGALPPARAVAALVNCAGMLRHEREWQVEAFEEVMRVNLTAGFALSNALLDRLVAAGGSVVNIASMWAIFGSPGAPAYTASKAAVAAVTRSQAVALLAV
jgi:NAD(P)-dependent dehydrogenase (short-subunit alcohol dehydrogenase family)